MSTPVRCRTAFHAVILATALTATLAVPPAHAHSPCDPTDNDRAEASRVLAGLTREIDVMEATIVEALRLQTGQLSGYAAQSAKAVTGALDAQTKLQAQIAREVEETRAMRARRPTDSGCAAITGLAGIGATRQAAESAYTRAAGRGDGTYRGRPCRRARCRRRRRQRGPLREPDEYLLQRSARRGGCRALPGRRCAPRRRSEGRQPVRPAHLRERSGTAYGGRAVAQSRRPRGARPAGAGLRRDRSGAPPRPARPLGRRPRRFGRRLLRPCPRIARTGRRARSLGRPGRAGTRCGNAGQPLRASGTARQPPVREPRLVRRSASDEPGEPAARDGHPASGIADARLAPLPARRTARRHRRHRVGACRRTHAAVCPASPTRLPERTDRHGRAPLPVRPGIDPLAHGRGAVFDRAGPEDAAVSAPGAGQFCTERDA